MKKLGLFIVVVGTLLSIVYPPYEYGMYQGYEFIWKTKQSFSGSIVISDWINKSQLGIQIIIICIIGFGLAIVGTLQEKNNGK